jgi:predicted dehydrogenase
MGIHWLDGFRRLLDSEARSILCRTHRSPAIACAGETEAHVQISFQNDATVSYVQSFSSPLARTETLIQGEEGLLVLDYHGAALYRQEAGREPVERWTNPFGGANKPESVFIGLDHLLRAMETGEEPPNSGRDNLRTVALLEAAYRSAAERRVVDLPDEGAP